MTRPGVHNVISCHVPAIPLSEAAMSSIEIFLSAGDESGDLHASNLMGEIKSMEQNVRFAGVGRSRMKKMGLRSVRRESEMDGAMWLHNLLRLGQFRQLLTNCRHYLKTERPDLVVLVDFGGFNLYVARAATELGLPVLYYIPPQVWAHGAHRAKKLKKWVNRVAVIYPFEVDFYRERSMKVNYVGHPLFDEIERHPPRQEIVEHIIGERRSPLIGLFPGSRAQEVRANLGIAMDACVSIKKAFPEASFAAVCPEDVRDLAADRAQEGPIDVDLLDVSALELAQAASLCITKSGTITLEIASQETPMLIFYRVNPVSWFLASGLKDTPYIGLVNTLAGRMVCPEKLMCRDDSEWLGRQALRMLQDSERYERCRQSIAEVMDGFAEPGASHRAARIALDMIQ